MQSSLLSSTNARFDTMYFSLNGCKSKFPLNMNTDPIFTLTHPAKAQILVPSAKKTSNKSVVHLDSQMQCVQCLKMCAKFSNQVWCHFCGQQVCKDCGPKDLKKHRVFYNSKKREAGKICKICDAKFTLR